MPLIYYIPPQYLDGFKELNSLTKEQFKELKKGLPKLKLTYSVDNLVKELDNEKFDKIDLEKIFSSIGSLIPYINKEEMIKEIVEDIVSIIDINDLFKIKEHEDFKAKLFFFLTDKHIYYASKSEDLIDNYGNVFILSRILSDIRPVFDINVEETPKAGFIVHNLSIHYQSSEEPYHRDISIQLTSNQIQELHETLLRAERKEKILKSVLKNSNIENLIE